MTSKEAIASLKFNNMMLGLLLDDCIETVENELSILNFLKEKFDIAVYHTRHNETGYELRISELSKPFNLLECLFVENISQEQYELFKRWLEMK